jgi:uncharacterized protein (DUF2336 family)
VTEATRVRLGASPHTDPGTLHDLAADPSVIVRAVLALNQAVPSKTNELLAGDPDERVRILLAGRLAALAPTLSARGQARLHRDTWETLRTLVRDEAVRVRAVIAEAIKDLPNAPRDIIVQLADDTDATVYEPVIRLSPLLTTEDLVSLVVKAPAAGTRRAVARREPLHETVSEAIATAPDSAAIRALLANPSAQIREATLDALIARSAEHPEWHEPLVSRPSLPSRSAHMLSEIVAAHLLETLAARADLPTALTQELRQRVAARLSQAVPAGCPTRRDVLMQARTLAAKDELNEDAVLAAARRGESRYAEAMLAVAARMPVSVVERASSLRSAKGMVSLAWKAGFTMRTALALQALLARLPPDAVLTAGPAGGFPLSVEEMRWQLDFLGRVEQ